jgi:ubiquitin C-terminal hydrolase
LQDCLDYFADIELLNDKKNLYQCENCSTLKYGKSTSSQVDCLESKKKFESPAIKRNMILELPYNLIINFKRFSHGFAGFSKNRKDVRFPVVLRMDRCTVQEGNKDTQADG